MPNRNWTILHKEELVATHGNTCVNCGSSDNVEWHHIVPLKDGGQNTIRNVVPLCYDCHMRIHFGNLCESTRRHNAGKRGGRPPKELDEDILLQYIHGEIHQLDANKKLGLGLRTKLHDMPRFKEFIKKMGILEVEKDYWGTITLKYNDGHAEVWENGLIWEAYDWE